MAPRYDCGDLEEGGKEMKKGNEKTWQRNPDQINTDKVQVWSANGSMLTAQCTRLQARELVASGKAFVCTEQAISYFDSK